jgi:hypothetical protein
MGEKTHSKPFEESVIGGVILTIRPDLLHERRRGIALHERHYFYFPPETFHDLPFKQFGAVVPALDVNVGSQDLQKLSGVVFAENKRGVHCLERPDEHGPVVFALQRARRTLELSNGLVAVDAHDQDVSAASCVGKILNMTRMEDIEAAVGGHEFFPARAKRKKMIADFLSG